MQRLATITLDEHPRPSAVAVELVDVGGNVVKALGAQEKAVRGALRAARERDVAVEVGVRGASGEVEVP